MLNRLRNKIDVIDKQMLKLFEKRMDVAKKVGAYKKQHGLPIFVPEREQAVIQSRVAALKNPEYCDLTVDFFADLMALSRRLQQKGSDKAPVFAPAVKNPRVAYLGIPGSNSSEALLEMFSDASEAISAESFDGIFNLLSGDRADYGVLPIENSSTGAITDVLDLLYKNNLYIVGEAFLKIHFVLAAPKGATLSGIRKVYSHPQGFLQCSDFINSLNEIEKIPLSSTADSALFVAKEMDIEKAAIVSPKAAELYGLVPLAENTETIKGNTTRFIAVAKQMEECPHADKISISFTLRHESGSLCKVLSAFSRHGLNLLYIESRPLPGRNFEYMFFTDFSGSLNTNAVEKAIEEIKSLSSSLQILGNYPSARE